MDRFSSRPMRPRFPSRSEVFRLAPVVALAIVLFPALAPAEEPWMLRLREGLAEHHAYLADLTRTAAVGEEPEVVEDALRFYKPFFPDSRPLGASGTVTKSMVASHDPSRPPGGHILRADVPLDEAGTVATFHALSTGLWVDSPAWMAYGPDGAPAGALEFTGRLWRETAADESLTLSSVIAGRPAVIRRFRVTIAPLSVTPADTIELEEADLAAAGATGDDWEEVLAARHHLGEPIWPTLSKARVTDLVSPPTPPPGAKGLLPEEPAWSPVDPAYDWSDQHLAEASLAAGRKSFAAPLDFRETEASLTRTLLETGVIPEAWGLGPVPEGHDIVISALSPMATDGAGADLPESAEFRPYPLANRLVESDYRHRVAFREFTVQVLPVAEHAGGTITVEHDLELAQSNLGRLPRDFPDVIEPGQGRRIPLDDQATARIRVHAPPFGWNHVELTITSDRTPTLSKRARFVNPIVVVIDPGHGGTRNLAGSNWNNATATVTGTLEKAMTLRYGLAVRDALDEQCQDRDIPARVILTREEDRNLTGEARASLAKREGADRLLVLHFNATNKVARGSLHVIRTAGQVNGSEDNAFSQRIVEATVGALKGFDPKANVRYPHNYNTAVATDSYLGNSADYHPVRLAYLEVEFIDTPSVDNLLNQEATRDLVRDAVALSLAEATLEDAMGGRTYETTPR